MLAPLMLGFLQEWQELYEKFFPPKAGAGKATKFVIDKQYAEIARGVVIRSNIWEEHGKYHTHAASACNLCGACIRAEVDLMRQRKQLELEAFCRDAEAAKELAKKRLAMARQGGHQVEPDICTVAFWLYFGNYNSCLSSLFSPHAFRREC
eukprot:1141323-Pelagomonas_calceolata.AAC.2